MKRRTAMRRARTLSSNGNRIAVMEKSDLDGEKDFVLSPWNKKFQVWTHPEALFATVAVFESRRRIG